MARRWLAISLLTTAVLVFVVRQPRAYELSAIKPGSSAAPSKPSAQLVVSGKVLGELVPPRPGEICVVCKQPIGAGDVVYLTNVQRVPIHAAVCYEKFLKNPLAYLAQLRPHGAFLGAGGEDQKLSWGWFLAGIYILLGLAFGALCAQRALNAGRNATVWFGAGFFLNAIGFLWLLTRPKLPVPAPGEAPEGLAKTPVTFAPQPCPACGRMNHPAAERCADCGAKLQPAVRSEVAKAGLGAH